MDFQSPKIVIGGGIALAVIVALASRSSGTKNSGALSPETEKTIASRDVALGQQLTSRAGMASAIETARINAISQATLSSEETRRAVLQSSIDAGTRNLSLELDAQTRTAAINAALSSAIDAHATDLARVRTIAESNERVASIGADLAKTQGDLELRAILAGYGAQTAIASMQNDTAVKLAMQQTQQTSLKLATAERMNVQTLSTQKAVEKFAIKHSGSGSKLMSQGLGIIGGLLGAVL